MPDPFKKVKIIELMELFDDDEVTTADQIDRPQQALDREAYEDFMKRNPLADGGMLVQPGFGGVRQGYRKPIMLTKEQQKIFRAYKKFPHKQTDSNIRQKIREGIITQDSIEKLKKGISLKATDKDKTALDEDTIKKIKEKIKLKPGQKWNFYDPETNPDGHTYGIKKSDNKLLYDRARNIGKPGRAEKKLKQAKETYEKIKADPKLLAQKKAYDRERFLAKGDEIRAQQNLKYETDKDFREKKLEWARQDRIKNPEKYKQKLNEYFAKKGRFPPGNNYKENVWRDMFRSSQKSGQERFLLVDEKGNLLTEDKFPKKDGRVRWDIGGAYKKVKFYDTVTEQFVKFDNSIKGKGVSFEKYLDQKSVGGKGAYKNAINGYRNKDDIKNLTFKDSKGKTIRLGTIVQERLSDGVNFINSGVNVQHPDLNNAFWKNEVSLASANQKLRDLEKTIERQLRNAGNDTTARTKAINNFKSEINKLPGGITKVIEGETFGVKPTTQSVVEAIGKETKLTRFKDFKNVRNKVLELASKVTDRCPVGGKADGGRIGYSLGSEACFKIGQKKLGDILTKGTGQKSEQILATQILKAGPLLKDAVSLRALLGPQAMIFYAGAEAGLVGYDMISKGKTLKEAVGDSLINPLLGPKLKQDSQKLFVERLQDLGVSNQDIGKGLMFDRMTEDVQTLNDLLQRKFIADQKVEESKQLYPAAVDKEEREAPGVGGFKFDKPFLSIPDVRDKRKKEADDIAMDIQDIYRTGDRNVLDALEFERFQKPETIERFVEAGAQKNFLNKLVEADRLLDAQDNILYKTLKGPRFKEKDREKIGEVFDIPPGFKFAGGGIAKLAGVDEGPPPESGPNSQGLSGLLKRGNKI